LSAIDISRAVEDTAALVRLDSQNPGALEGACARWIRERIGAAGLSLDEIVVAEGRDNLVASVTGNGERPRLILLAHMDTVPAGDGWTFDPLSGEIRSGRIWGRGAADMKSGLAVALNLLESLKKGSAPQPRGDVVLCATVDEEGPEMAGAHALVGAGVLRPDDQILALEPTGLRLRIAQVGLRWLELRVHGRMAHAGRAHLGVDAIHVAARIVDRLKQRVTALPYEDELLGRPLFTCGRIEGGVATNVVPPSCTVELDLRLVPPLTAEDVVMLVEAVVDETLVEFPGARSELQPLGVARPPVHADDDAPIVTRLRAAYEAVTGSALESGGADGHEAYTDASMIAALTGSASCTVFGPGSSDQAHAADEYVELSDIATVAHVLEELVERW
jgi:acetylornithine deacetylase/succinyl-diaminopimelate desuccinylase family protein